MKKILITICLMGIMGCGETPYVKTKGPIAIKNYKNLEEFRNLFVKAMKFEQMQFWADVGEYKQRVPRTEGQFKRVDTRGCSLADDPLCHDIVIVGDIRRFIIKKTSWDSTGKVLFIDILERDNKLFYIRKGWLNISEGKTENKE